MQRSVRAVWTHLLGPVARHNGLRPLYVASPHSAVPQRSVERRRPLLMQPARRGYKPERDTSPMGLGPAPNDWELEDGTDDVGPAPSNLDEAYDYFKADEPDDVTPESLEQYFKSPLASEYNMHFDLLHPKREVTVEEDELFAGEVYKDRLYLPSYVEYRRLMETFETIGYIDVIKGPDGAEVGVTTAKMEFSHPNKTLDDPDIVQEAAELNEMQLEGTGIPKTRFDVKLLYDALIDDLKSLVDTPFVVTKDHELAREHRKSELALRRARPKMKPRTRSRHQIPDTLLLQLQRIIDSKYLNCTRTKDLGWVARRLFKDELRAKRKLFQEQLKRKERVEMLLKKRQAEEAMRRLLRYRLKKAQQRAVTQRRHKAHMEEAKAARAAKKLQKQANRLRHEAKTRSEQQRVFEQLAEERSLWLSPEDITADVIASRVAHPVGWVPGVEHWSELALNVESDNVLTELQRRYQITRPIKEDLEAREKFLEKKGYTTIDEQDQYMWGDDI